MTDAAVHESRLETALLRQAIELAVANVSAGQLPFGALVVRDGRILATGVNSTLRDDDPTAHAEVAAIRNACRELRTLTLPGATLISSCEPCALCHAAAVSAGVLRLVYAAPTGVRLRDARRATGPACRPARQDAGRPSFARA